jgi:putative endonuclease
MNRKKKGDEGEHAVGRFLEGVGYEIVAKNYRNRRGEIDIIAKTGCDIVFFEVKNWDEYPFDSLEFALNRKKRKNIIQASKEFLYRNRIYRDLRIRYDLLFCTNGDATSFKHIKNVFTESGKIW